MLIVPDIFNHSVFRYKRSLGRSRGVIVLRSRGGGLFYCNKRLLFKYPFNLKTIKILDIFKDYPFRTAFIAKVCCDFNNYIKYCFMIIHSKCKIGDIYYNLCNYNINDLNWNYFGMQSGNLYCVKNLPVGTLIYNLEVFSGSGCTLIRAAGCFGVIVKHDIISKKTIIKLPSKQVLSVSFLSRAFLGVVSNESYKFKNFNKAGFNRCLGIRPHVRGVAMNSVDHPHGGGRGKTKGGRPSVSMWGWLTKGKKTVNRK